MLAYVLIGIAAAIALVLILAATKPNTVHYARSAVINAPTDRIFSYIEDFPPMADVEPVGAAGPSHGAHVRRTSQRGGREVPLARQQEGGGRTDGDKSACPTR